MSNTNCFTFFSYFLTYNFFEKQKDCLKIFPEFRLNFTFVNVISIYKINVPINYLYFVRTRSTYVLYDKCRTLRFPAGKYFKRGKLKTCEKETDIGIPAQKQKSEEYKTLI